MVCSAAEERKREKKREEAVTTGISKFFCIANYRTAPHQEGYLEGLGGGGIGGECTFAQSSAVLWGEAGLSILSTLSKRTGGNTILATVGQVTPSPALHD